MKFKKFLNQMLNKFGLQKLKDKTKKKINLKIL